MPREVGITLAIAIWGALTGTVGLGMDAWSLTREMPRVTVAPNEGTILEVPVDHVQGDSATADFALFLTNHGFKPVSVTDVDAELAIRGPPGESSSFVRDGGRISRDFDGSGTEVVTLTFRELIPVVRKWVDRAPAPRFARWNVGEEELTLSEVDWNLPEPVLRAAKADELRWDGSLKITVRTTSGGPVNSRIPVEIRPKVRPVFTISGGSKFLLLLPDQDSLQVVRPR